ncbi:hypothetical protein Kpol_1015p7 [Vanderwaltozyma polyspora DSM 70294]|uniref:Protein YTP1-like C-terminal domain-containing protein n=1 Tax=Vanderwaltozyma polyspora (strain ATCC 22028 / DSM 70294 / BCRC 21397 / CBS 2163 / NBRC 10782 / NRRL Y-8283 / UCD 57-17) TaxID=436907 RepID=A7TQN7_VANPO|nr:uncharacterized protein Kpol_1015p7 [Vanderwaltozyma polyspora DSM 70294]EDO15418.1 hypothetical protein Kpol_1015p7 [Vanderwaltozyma polyspora DSM 70294]
MNRRIFLICACLLTLGCFAKGDEMSHMAGMDNLDDYTRPDIVNAGSRTFHWLSTVLFLLLVPSLAACFSFANKVNSSVFLQTISGIYAIFEALLFRFADNDGVENRVSRGTAWTILILLWSSVFFGCLHSGTGVLLKNKKLQTFVSKTGETKIKYLHSGLSFLVVVNGWVKVCLAPVALFGFCRESHTGQCIAHGVMGSAFVLYGFIYAMVLVIPWIRNNKGPYSQDYIDSWIMCIWGIVNTFTEHRWGREGWNHGDYQHTAMGIIWWAGGILGIFLSRGGRRTFVPSLLIIFTGWAMSEHTQHLIISTKVHYLFGLVLMAGGSLRIVEISFLLKDQRTLETIHSFQYLPPFCLVCAGVLFMGANEEQLILVLRLHADHSAYSLVAIAGAFMVYFWMLSCLSFYLRLVETQNKGFLSSYEPEEDVNYDINSPDFELSDNLSEET